ncbi:hypothetical protein BX666DRAFT_857171 [Dichotomocladium elegans]|nr:hypothetical protein BX666DRAFT_857171 [Dichotomocladium elegans]
MSLPISQDQPSGSDENLLSMTRMESPISASSNSSSSLSNYLDRTTPTSTHFPEGASPTLEGPFDGSQPAMPIPTRSLSATTLTMQPPPSGGGSQTKRHSLRSQPPPPLQHLPRQESFTSSNSSSNTIQAGSLGLDRTMSMHSGGGTYQQRPTSPITSPSIHKSLNALDAKSITRDIERSIQHVRGDETITSPSSPSASMNPSGYYFSPNNGSQPGTYHWHHPPAASSTAQQSVAPYAHHPVSYIRQGSVSSISIPATANTAASIAATTIVNPPTVNPQGDVWQSLCVRVLPLFNGEGVKGNIEDLNELLR